MFFDRDDKDEQQCTNRVNSWIKSAKTVVLQQKISIGSWKIKNTVQDKKHHLITL